MFIPTWMAPSFIFTVLFAYPSHLDALQVDIHTFADIADIAMPRDDLFVTPLRGRHRPDDLFA